MNKRKIALILAFLVLVSGAVTTVQTFNVLLYIKNLTATINGLCFDGGSFVSVLFDVELAGKSRGGGWPS